MAHRMKKVLVGASMVLAGAASPAAAHAPAPDIFPLTGLSLDCAGDSVTFTSGMLAGTLHEHEGRRGGSQLVFSLRLRDAWLVDGDGDMLRAVGSANNSSVYVDGEEFGTFTANFTLIGPQGKEGAVHLLMRGTDEGLIAVDRGSCQIAW